MLIKPGVARKFRRFSDDKLRLEQSAKTFLPEVYVVGENVSYPFGSHRIHGNTVREAVALIETSFVKVESGKEGLVALWHYLYSGIV